MSARGWVSPRAARYGRPVTGGYIGLDRAPRAGLDGPSVVAAAAAVQLLPVSGLHWYVRTGWPRSSARSRPPPGAGVPGPSAIRGLLAHPLIADDGVFAQGTRHTSRSDSSSASSAAANSPLRPPPGSGLSATGSYISSYTRGVAPGLTGGFYVSEGGLETDVDRAADLRLRCYRRSAGLCCSGLLRVAPAFSASVRPRA